MSILRCLNCGELINPDFIDDKGGVALCSKCGEYTLATESQCQAEIYSVRELLSDAPPENVEVGMGQDGGYVYLIKPADRKRQILNLAMTLLFLLFSLVPLIVLVPDMGERFCDMLMGLGLTFKCANNVRVLALLGVMLGGVGLFLLSLVFLSRLSGVRLSVSAERLTMQELFCGRVPIGRMRALQCNREFVVDYETVPRPFAFRKARPAKCEVYINQEGRRPQKFFSCRDAKTAQYVRALVLKWLGKVGCLRSFVCRSCGAEIDCSGVDIKSNRVHCPICGFESAFILAQLYREAVRKRRVPKGVVVKDGEPRCSICLGWRISAMFWNSISGLVFGAIVCLKLAKWLGGSESVWALLGIGFLVAVPVLAVVSLLINRFRSFEIVCESGRVVCDVRGIMRKRQTEVPLEGLCAAMLFSANDTRIRIATDISGKNEHITELVRNLSPDVCRWLMYWLNIRLLKAR